MKLVDNPRGWFDGLGQFRHIRVRQFNTISTDMSTSSTQSLIVRSVARAIIADPQAPDRLLVVACEDARGTWYVFPGGGQRHGEDLHTTLQREVFEELGVRISIGPLRFVRECIAAQYPDDDRGNLPDEFHQVEHFFTCTFDSKSERATPRPDLSLATELDPGQTGFAWLTVDQLESVRYYPRGLAQRLREARDEMVYLGVIC